MPRVELPFTYGGGDLGGLLDYPSNQYNSENIVNMMPVPAEQGNAKSSFKLKATPAASEFTDLSILVNYNSTKFLGSHTCSNGLLVVCFKNVKIDTGDNYIWLYAIGENGTIDSAWGQNKGATDPDPVKITDNGVVISLVDGTNGYFSQLFDTTIGPFQTITDPDFPTTPIDVVFKDTYFIWLDDETGRFYISTSYADDVADCVNALDFGVVESQPDKAVALGTIGNELVVFGTRTIEFFYNSGNVDFPFERNSGATQDIGAVSRFTINKIGNNLYFYGTTPTGGYNVYVMNGYQPKIVSSRYIEEKLSKGAGAIPENDIYSFSYSYMGSDFYCIRTEQYKLFCYDSTVGSWHIRVDGGETSEPLTKGASYAYGKNIVFLNLPPTNFLYAGIVSDEIYDYTDFPLPLTYEFVNRFVMLKHITAENKNIQINYFEMDIQKGVGNVDDPDPEITLTISRDGGMTYGSPIKIKMGTSGSYKQRVRVDMLGVARDAVFKLQTLSPVQQEWFTAYIDYEVMSE